MGWHWDRTDDPTLHLLKRILELEERNRCCCKCCCHEKPKPEKVTVNVKFNVLQGGKPMAVLPPISVFSTEKQPMNLNPVRGGQTDVDETIHPTVTSSDPAQVGVEVSDAANNEYFLLTPLDSGTATITISHPLLETDSFEFSYSPFVPGHSNPTFGAPVSDT